MQTHFFSALGLETEKQIKLGKYKIPLDLCRFGARFKGR